MRDFGVPTVSPVPFLIFWRFGVSDFFCTAKGTIKSAAPAPPDFTPKSLKSYFLIFLDLQSLRTICNPLGPSGNNCRMQHILLLSCNSSFQLIERFAIKEDSPLHTTKASPGGSSRSSRKNASGSAWQLRFSWFLCRPNTALAPSCSTENRSVKRAKGRKKQAHDASFDWLNWLWMFAGFSFISEASLYPLTFLRNFHSLVKTISFKTIRLLQSIPKSYIEESKKLLLFERKTQKKQIKFKLWQHANNGGQPLHFGHGYGICFAPLLACSASAHISVPGVTIFNTDAVSANPDGCATVTLERTIKIHLNKTMVWSFWGTTNLQLCWMSQTKPKPCTVLKQKQHSAPTSNASVLPSGWARKQKRSCTMKPDETNVVAPSSRLIAALLGHAGSWYMHSSPKRNRRAEGLSIKIKWITHYQLTYCNILRQVQTGDAMVCCISTLCMALRSSAQGPRGLNYGMGSFAIAGHGMPSFLVRRRSEYCFMPRHVFFRFFGKKSEAHQCCRDAICLNTPKIAWQGSTPEIFNVFAPGIAGLHLGEDWECCQRLQRRNSAEGLTEKLVPLEVKSAAPESVTQKLPTNEVKKFRSSLIPKRFTSHSCIKRRCCWSDHELARWMKLKEDDLCTFPGFVPPPEAQEASRQKSIAHVHLSQKDGWQDCEGSKAQTSCKNDLADLASVSQVRTSISQGWNSFRFHLTIARLTALYYFNIFQHSTSQGPTFGVSGH